MKNIIRFGSLAALFLFLAIPAFAEEALSEDATEQTMTEEATTTSESQPLSRGALYRMRSKCAQLMDHAKWKECRTETLNLRKASIDARRETRDELVKDQAGERRDAALKPIKKDLPKDFTDFNYHFRNYNYLKESPRTSTTENHVRFRAERLRQRKETGGAGQRSRMMKDDSEDAGDETEDGVDAE